MFANTLVRDTVSHCVNANTEHCETDQYAFHMTKKHNKLDWPYDPDNHNRYSLALKQPEFMSCKVVVRDHGPETEISVYEMQGEKQQLKDSKTFTDTPNGELMTVQGELPYPLDVISRAETGNPYGFQYAVSRDGIFESDLMKLFGWSWDSKGTSTQVKRDGSYCTSQDKGSNEIVRTCYFPCIGR